MAISRRPGMGRTDGAQKGSRTPTPQGHSGLNRARLPIPPSEQKKGPSRGQGRPFVPVTSTTPRAEALEDLVVELARIELASAKFRWSPRYVRSRFTLPTGFAGVATGAGPSNRSRPGGIDTTLNFSLDQLVWVGAPSATRTPRLGTVLRFLRPQHEQRCRWQLLVCSVGQGVPSIACTQTLPSLHVETNQPRLPVSPGRLGVLDI